MRVAIIQPHFLPFIGYFDLMNRVDLFIYYDTVQFVRRSWHCRTYITEKSQARWLSAPVRTAEGSRRLLYLMQWADDQPWRKRMGRRLQQSYKNCAEPQLLQDILKLIELGPSSLTDWNIRANDLLAAALNIKTMTLRASSLPQVEGDKQQRIIQMCREVGATRYLCGPGSRNYVREADFAEFQLKVDWLDYDYEYYATTIRGAVVFPSVLDLMLLKGAATAVKEIHPMRQANEKN